MRSFHEVLRGDERLIDGRMRTYNDMLPSGWSVLVFSVGNFYVFRSGLYTRELCLSVGEV